jgi:hypothetical protein
MKDGTVTQGEGGGIADGERLFSAMSCWWRGGGHTMLAKCIFP